MSPLSEDMDTPLPQKLYAVGFSRWKRAALRAFVPESQIHFRNSQESVPPGATLLLWGQTPCLKPAQHSVVRVEDGFLRSVGLGADLIVPLSYCFDRTGLYYDARSPSDLETLLQNTHFSPAMLDRAQALRARLVELGLTKYNVGNQTWQRPTTAQEVILVPGQVESDAAITLGCGTLRTNLALLQRVRAEHPQAYMVYKPHPDVMAGLRRWGEAEREQAHQYCDALVTDVPMDKLLREVDRVEVLTSAAGFEALLREKPVTCHGQPFYSGWGLTTDKNPLPRRQRTLSLDALVAGVLIAYPRYQDPRDGRRCTPEAALSALDAMLQKQRGRATPLWRKAFRVVLRQTVGVR